MVGSELNKIRRFLDSQADRREITTYKITETLFKNNRLPYQIKNLNFEYEDGIIIFNDADEIIWEDDHNVLRQFLINSAELKITMNNINIKFENGNINIKVVG